MFCGVSEREGRKKKCLSQMIVWAIHTSTQVKIVWEFCWIVSSSMWNLSLPTSIKLNFHFVIIYGHKAHTHTRRMTHSIDMLRTRASANHSGHCHVSTMKRNMIVVNEYAYDVPFCKHRFTLEKKCPFKVLSLPLPIWSLNRTVDFVPNKSIYSISSRSKDRHHSSDQWPRVSIRCKIVNHQKIEFTVSKIPKNIAQHFKMRGIVFATKLYTGVKWI